jgi:hypothetical protein
VRVIAERLVLRGAAAAERHPIARRSSRELDVRALLVVERGVDHVGGREVVRARHDRDHLRAVVPDALLGVEDGAEVVEVFVDARVHLGRGDGREQHVAGRLAQHGLHRVASRRAPSRAQAGRVDPLDRATRVRVIEHVARGAPGRVAHVADGGHGRARDGVDEAALARTPPADEGHAHEATALTEAAQRVQPPPQLAVFGQRVPREDGLAATERAEALLARARDARHDGP